MLLKLKLLFTYFFSKKESMDRVKDKKKKIVIALAANYGNLGDVAITYAQKKFLRERFPEYEVIEFKISDTFSKMKSLKKSICKEDIITIVGGGNMGDLYVDIEFARQFIIKNFPQNKIVIFPQTIFFSKTIRGKMGLWRAKRIYNKHKKLTLFVREKYSYERYHSYFKNMKLVPDIVLSMNYAEPIELKRESVTICFRNDKENGIKNEMKSRLISELEKYYVIKKKDTHIGRQADLKKLYEELNILVNIFQNSKVVVTDRLHGMILSYITHTPCVVFSGGNKKIEGCYNWIAESNYIKLIESLRDKKDIDFALLEIEKIYKLEENQKKFVDINSKFDEISKAIESE